MKIVTWNCGGAFRKKFSLLNHFDADILVVQECEDPRTVKHHQYQDWATNCLWVGENKLKGLGIFARKGISIKPLDWDCSFTCKEYGARNLQYFIACTVNEEFILLGAWCHGVLHGKFAYIGQFYHYLKKHKEKLFRTVIAGDFNSNVIWDKPGRYWNHSDVVRDLKDLKIESTYHHFYKEEPGKESIATFFLHRNLEKKYHIDYVFASAEYLRSIRQMEIGKVKDWIKISDHMPVSCEF